MFCNDLKSIILSLFLLFLKIESSKSLKQFKIKKYPLSIYIYDKSKIIKKW